MAYTPNASFDFTGTTYTPDGNYTFGVDGGVEGNFDVQLDDASSVIIGDISLAVTFDVQVEDASGSFVANRYDYLGQFSVQVDDCIAGIIGEYDPNVNRQIRYHVNNAIVENTEKLPFAKTCFVVEQGSRLDKYTNSNQLFGTFLFDCTEGAGDNGTYLSTWWEFTHDTGSFLSDSACFNYEQGTFIDFRLTFAYEQCSYVSDGVCAIVQQMTKVYPNRWEMVNQDSWRQIDFLHPVMLEPFPSYDPNSGNIEFNDTNYLPDGDFQFNFGRPSNLYVRHIWGVLSNGFNSSWNEANINNVKRCSVVEETKYPDRGRTTWIDLPRPDPDPEPPSGSTHVVPIQEVYTVLNTIVVTLDDDITPIQLDKLNLSIDADSSAWSFNAELLDPAEVSLIQQLPDGTAIELHITINGYTWYVLVEKIQTNRTYGKQSIKISGRGLTALLSKPYEQPISVNFGTDSSINNIVNTILPFDWNSLGDTYWLLGEDPISSPVTWVVDAGAYSYQNKTPIEAIKDVVEDIGAMIVPSRDSQEIYFKSRYSVLPWNFGAVAVDVAIPDSAILQLTEEPVSSFQANGVYVHGNEIGGKLAFVRLNGTAGDRLAPTINNSLMTDTVGLRSLGERILSGQYSQPKIKSITTFMDGTLIPLIELGDFVGLTVDSVETKGIVNAVSISATLSDVTQSITIGESTPNTWVAFKEILPKDPMLVGTLGSTDGTTSLMTLLDGGVVRVRGTGTVGGKYYIRSGEIVSDAPNIIQEADIVL